MISHLRGKVLDIGTEEVVLDVQGVGYEVFCSTSTLSQLQGEEFVNLHIYTSVREDAITLFGFAKVLEKKLFLSLIKVNGIGPKMASQVLSAAPVETICQYIDEGDAKGLSSLPKIGKKKAEQIILSLKGKLVLPENAKPKTLWSAARDEISSALINLGFRPQDVQKVAEALPKDISVQQGIRQALGQLSSAKQQRSTPTTARGMEV